MLITTKDPILIPPIAPLSLRAVRQQYESVSRRFVGLFRECWLRMKFMNAEFERFEEAETSDGIRSRGRNEERLRDELAWSRMDDDGWQPSATPPGNRSKEVEGHVYT